MTFNFTQPLPPSPHSFSGSSKTQIFDDTELPRARNLPPSSSSDLARLPTCLQDSEYEAASTSKQADNLSVNDEVQCFSDRIKGRIDQAASIERTIGPGGGKLELFGCLIEIPDGALESEVMFEVMVDTNSSHFPSGRIIVAPVLRCKPSMKFTEPVNIQMMTCCPGDSVDLSILFKKKGMSDWQEIIQGVRCTEGSTVQFQVMHFCSFAAVLWKIPVMLGILAPPPMYIYNDVYIEPSTGSITSVFFLNKKVQSDIQEEMVALKYEKAIPLAERFIWNQGEVWDIRLVCEQPRLDVTARNHVINFDNDFMKSIQDFFHKASFVLDYIPGDDVTELRMTYEINKGNHVEDRIEPFTIVKKWPMKKAGPGIVVQGDMRSESVVLG